MRFTNDMSVAGEQTISTLAGKKILFANFPADGHFNPLTGLAVHLMQLGCDVRWYTSDHYSAAINDLGIRHYPFKKALDTTLLEEAFPERNNIRGQIEKLRFDMINAFVLRGPEYYADIEDIYHEFRFDAVIADCAFTAIPFLTDKMNIPVIAVGVFPLTQASRDLPPAGLGMTPNHSLWGKVRDAVFRFISSNVLFREPNRVLHQTLSQHKIDHLNSDIFNLITHKATLFLQSGTPGFEYRRSDLGKNIRYIGALLPLNKAGKRKSWHDVRLNQYSQTIIVTQGTIEKDVEKLIVPTLEAYKNTDVLVIATTGGSETMQLRKRFPQENIIIEDFIAFSDIMPYADVYITNGGYGGVMLGIEHQLPMVVAGVHEGKNEINARVGYFGLGINLKTEKPRPDKLKQAADRVLKDRSYRENVGRLQREFLQYNPQTLFAEYLAEMLSEPNIIYKRAAAATETGWMQ